MSKGTSKRGFVAPQPQPAIKTTFAEALANYELTNDRAEAWYAKHEDAVTFTDDQKAELTFIGWRAARDRVFATPALTPNDLAGKIATLCELPGLFDYHPARTSHQEIVAKGGDADHALLACYLDALSLTGAVPDIAVRDQDFEALLSEVRQASAMWERDADRTDGVKAQNEGREVTAEDHRAWEAASTRHFEAVDRLINYRPTSLQQLAAKARELAGDTATGYRGANYDLAETCRLDADHLARIEAGALIMQGSPIDDFAVEAAEVLKMERQLLASHDAELEGEWDKRCMAAIDAADALPATEEHLASKVLGLRLIYENNGGLEQLDAGTTDARLLRDIAKTLIAMGIGA